MDNKENRLADVLKERGLSQTELAEKAGVTRSHVSYVASNKSSTRVSTIFQFAKALDAPAYTLIGDYREPTDLEILEKASNILGVEIQVLLDLRNKKQD